MIDEELEHIRAEKMRKLMDEYNEHMDNVWLFIQCTENALSNGVKHVDRFGNRLYTVLEICNTLLRDGYIEIYE